MSFDRLGLAPELLRAVASQGYTEPTPVQARIDPARPGRPRPARRRPDRDRQDGRVRAADAAAPARRAAVPGAAGQSARSILTPTRELALQVEESVRTYGAQNPIRSTTIYGGVGFEPQVRHLRAGPEIVVATPGPAARPRRPADDRPVAGRDPRPRRGRPDARHGLHPRHPQDPRAAARRAARTCSSRRRSRTRSGAWPTACSTTRRPSRSRPATRATELVRQVVHPVDRERKRELLSHLIRTGRIDQALVFTRTKHGANRLAEQLEHDGIAAAAIHGNKSQPPAGPRAGRLQGRPGHDPRRHRGRRARPRHRRAAARRQLRAADGPRGLRPPDRPDRSGRRRRRRDLARLRRRAAAAARHRAPARARRSRARSIDGLRARPLDPAGADPAWRARRRAPGRSTPGCSTTTRRRAGRWLVAADRHARQPGTTSRGAPGSGRAADERHGSTSRSPWRPGRRRRPRLPEPGTTGVRRRTIRRRTATRWCPAARWRPPTGPGSPRPVRRVRRAEAPGPGDRQRQPGRSRAWATSDAPSARRPGRWSRSTRPVARSRSSGRPRDAPGRAARPTRWTAPGLSPSRLPAPE